MQMMMEALISLNFYKFKKKWKQSLIKIIHFDEALPLFDFVDVDLVADLVPDLADLVSVFFSVVFVVFCVYFSSFTYFG